MGRSFIYKIHENSKWNYIFTNRPDKGQIQRLVDQEGKDQNTEIAITERKVQNLTNTKVGKT